MFNGVLWILNDFVQIRILPFRYGNYPTIRPSKTEEKKRGIMDKELFFCNPDNKQQN
jgi:hypothetical protein